MWLYLLLLNLFSFNLYAEVQKHEKYIEAKFIISGELEANAEMLLTIGTPAKMMWNGIGPNETDYALIIPAINSGEEKPGIYVLLLKRKPGDVWEVVSEAHSLNNSHNLLNLTSERSKIDIKGKYITRDAYISKFNKIR